MKWLGRRIFYETGTGNIIKDTGEKQGLWLVDTTVEQDILTWTELSERNRETFDVLELPFGAYAQDFAEAALIGVDLEKRIPLFEYPDPNNPDQPIELKKPLSVEIEELRMENSILNMSVLELSSIAAQQDELNKTNEQAILELSMMISGGA